MSDGTHSQLQKILKILSLFVRVVLLLLALVVACNFFSSIIKVYTMEWYLHCEYEALGLFFGNFFGLQLRECPACFLIFLSVVSSSHETDRLSRCA